MGGRGAMRLRIQKIKDQTTSRPAGYVEEVLSRGVVDGEWLEISPEELAKLRDKYRPKPQAPPRPSLPVMAANYAAAQARDFIAGKPRRTEEELEHILEVCRSCTDHFRPSDQTCSLCGCPIADKSPLAREHCPIGKW